MHGVSMCFSMSHWFSQQVQSGLRECLSFSGFQLAPAPAAATTATISTAAITFAFAFATSRVRVF